MKYCTCGCALGDEIEKCPRCKKVFEDKIQENTMDVNEMPCPDCGTPGSLIMQEGCVYCTACAYSKCG